MMAQPRAETLAGMLPQQAGLLQRLDALVLADRDELHFRRDDAAPRVVHLGDVGAGARAARATQRREPHVGELRSDGVAAAEPGTEIGQQLAVAARLRS